MASPAVVRKRRVWPLVAAVLIVVLVAGVMYWAWPRPGPPVTLLGIDRTLTYNGSTSGYVFGTITSGCPICPLDIRAGSSVTVNASWLETNPLGSHLNYTFINVTIHSPFPFLAVDYSVNNRPLIYTYHTMDEAGGPGGWFGLQLTIDIPFDSTGLQPTGTIMEWINATASSDPWPPPPS